MNISRRSVNKLMLGGVAALAAPYHFVRAETIEPKKGDELVVGIWGGEQEKLVKEFIEKPLVDKYGCKISYVLGGTPERRARAYSERGRPSFDVLYLNIFESRQAVKDGVTQAPTDAVANAQYLYPMAKKGGYGVALNPCTIIYNSKKASAPITSWKDLWNDEWRGRIAWPTGLGAEGISALMMSTIAWFGDQHKMAPDGFDKIRELKPFASMQSSDAQMFDMFDQKIADVSIEFEAYCREYIDHRNKDFALAAPKEGRPIAMNVACITVGTKNQKLSEEWINLHLSVPCMEAYAQRIGYSPTVSNVTLPDDLKRKLVTPENIGSLVDFDWDYINANRSKWQSIFDRELAG